MPISLALGMAAYPCGETRTRAASGEYGVGFALRSHFSPGNEKGGPEAPDRPLRDALGKRLALRELEAAACLGAAVLLALDDARVAGQEACLLHRGAERRLEAAQRLRDAVLHRTGLARKAATLHGGDDVVLTIAVGNVERLVDDEAQRGTGEVDALVAAVDLDLARARLQPDSRNGILAAAGRIGAGELVELLLAKRRLDLGRRRRSSGLGRCFGRFRSRSWLRRLLTGQLGEVGKGLAIVGHYAPTLFLRFIAATSSGCGSWPPCGCSVPL